MIHHSCQISKYFPRFLGQRQRWISWTKTKVDFFFERANILSKSQLIRLIKAQKLRKSQLFETKLVNFFRPKLVKISHFLGQRWDYQSPYHLSTLGRHAVGTFLASVTQGKTVLPGHT